MTTTTHGHPKPVDLQLGQDDEELWDEKIEALLAANDMEGARAEFERQCLVSLDSGVIEMTPENWAELRLKLHREAGLAS